VGSHSLDKRYFGDPHAIGVGEMISAGDFSVGNAGYVVIERVNGTLIGRTGTFAIMQMGKHGQR
jgi:hypothetical protein